jgi:two-component system sensor histidine kinase ChvG
VAGFRTTRIATPVLRRLAASLTLKLAALIGLFVALPIVLYGQFESADSQMQELVTRAIQDRSALIAEALAPVLRETDPSEPMNLNRDLAKYASSGTVLKLMFQPPAARTASRFFLVASAPPLAPEAVTAELEELGQRGILQRLSEACTWNASDEMRYRRADGTVELLTSIIPIRARGNCWILTTTHVASDFLDTSIGRPYWQTREIRIAAAIYLVGAVLAVLVALGIRLSLRRFRNVADEIALGRAAEATFAQRNTVPELAGVARDFDRLVHELRRVSREIRQSAEDNAHSFKTPLAAVQSALRPVRRAVPEEDQRARRALEIIDSSLARLLNLVNAAQRHDMGSADLIDAPRRPTNLALLVEDAARHFREILAAREIGLVMKLDRGAIVRAAAGMMEIVLQNVLENAISFSAPGANIAVSLRVSADTVELTVDDEGPGIDAERIESIFQRYFSSRPEDGIGSDRAVEHSGLGLWIVRRNVEALGGQVSAANRPGRGLSIRILLPRFVVH